MGRALSLGVCKGVPPPSCRSPFEGDQCFGLLGSTALGDSAPSQEFRHHVLIQLLFSTCSVPRLVLGLWGDADELEVGLAPCLGEQMARNRTESRGNRHLKQQVLAVQMVELFWQRP